MMVRKLLNWTVTAILIIVILLVLTLTISTKLGNGQASFLNTKVMVVLSGSMSPTFNVGSVVFVTPVKPEEISTDDIITFKDRGGLTVTHRVLEIKDNKIITKGDANDTPDPDPVTDKTVIGRVKFWIPYAGYFINFMKSKTGIVLFLIVPGVLLIISQGWKLIKILLQNEENVPQA